MAVALRLTKDLVARLPCGIPDPGPMTRAVPDAWYTGLTRAVLDKCTDEELWVFAYGSILWKRRSARLPKLPSPLCCRRPLRHQPIQARKMAVAAGHLQPRESAR